jgi:hypothetical protein
MQETNKLCLALLVAAMSILSAIANDFKTSPMLFPQFENGYAVLKNNGARIAGQFNYDKVQESMFSYDAEGVLIQLDPTAISLIVIGERFFFPVGNAFFYERISTEKGELYLRHKAIALSKGRASGYGSYSQTAAIGNGVNHRMGLYSADEIFDFEDKSVLYLNNGRRDIGINSLRRLTAHFNSHRKKLETFARENRIVFTNVEDVKTIVAYAFSLQ